MKTLASTLLALGLCSSAAFAAEEIDFATLDANGDGMLGQQEVANDTRVSANFDTWDSNGDGFLDEAEVNANAGTQTEAISQPLDDSSAEADAGTELETTAAQSSAEGEASIEATSAEEEPLWEERDSALEEEDPTSVEDDMTDDQVIDE